MQKERSVAVTISEDGGIAKDSDAIISCPLCAGFEAFHGVAVLTKT